MAGRELDDSVIYAHLQELARAKRVHLQIALEIADDYPNQARLLIKVMNSLVRSANSLLADTAVD